MSDATIARAYLQLLPSMRGSEKAIKDEFGKAGEKSGAEFNKGFEKASKSGDGFVSTLEKNSTKMLIAATAAAGGLFGLASAAGGLNAALQTSDRVFGDASKSVKTFAADTSDAVFLSESAALQAANSFGIFGKQAGMSADEASSFSIRMVQMAADLAAVADVPVSQAILDMRSAFAGSTETMQKYGINLNETELKAAYFAETGEKITGVMTAQQKTMAVHWALLEKGAFAFGAAESESSQFAAQVDRLKGTVGNIAADFGQPVVGFAAGILDAVSGGLENLTGFNDATGGMFATGISASVGLAAAAVGVGGLVGKVSELGKKMVSPTGGLTTMGKFAGAIGLVGVGLTAGFTIYGMATRHSKELAEQSKNTGLAMQAAINPALEFTDALRESGGAASGATAAMASYGIAMKDTFKEVTDEMLGSFGVAREELGGILSTLAADLGDADATAASHVQVLHDLGLEYGLTADLAGLASNAVVLYSSASDDNLSTTQGLITALVGMGYGLERATELVEGLTAEQMNGIRGMEDFYDAARSTDFEGWAQGVLNASIATSDWAKETIRNIEAQTGLNRNMGDAATVYELFMAELMKLPPAQRAAALAGGELADGLDDAAGSAKTFDLIAANTIDTTSDAAKGFKAAADRVSAFDNALRRMTDPAFRAQQAMLDQLDAADKLTERISEARKGTDGYSLTLDKNTDAGRENRRAIMDRASAILEEISTMVEQGASVEEVERRYIELREELIDQASAFTDTRLEAQQYVQELGMVPSSVYTAFDIVNNDQAHAKVDEILGQMDKIPPELHSRIRPLMDQDDYRAVLIQLAAFSTKTVSVGLKLVPGGGIAASALNALANAMTGKKSAYGNYVPANSFQHHLVGERGWDEAIIPTGNKAATKSLLDSDPRIREPLRDYFGERYGFDAERYTNEPIELETVVDIPAEWHLDPADSDTPAVFAVYNLVAA